MPDKSMSRSILSQVRADAYAEGFRQGVMVGFDEAYENGRADALREAGQQSRRWRWLCFVCGSAVAVLLVIVT